MNPTTQVLRCMLHDKPAPGNMISSPPPRQGRSICIAVHDEISSRCYITVCHGGTNSRIFPKDVLATKLTDVVIDNILTCICDKCKSDKSLFPHLLPSNAKHRQNRASLITKNESSAISLFALLIYLERPQLILGFLDRKQSDYFLLESGRTYVDKVLTPEQEKSLAGDFWPEYLSDSPEGATSLLHRFLKTLPRFAIPNFGPELSGTFSKSTIMPFIDENLVGKGTYGDVHKFKVHPYYLKLEVCPSDPLLAPLLTETSFRLPIRSLPGKK